MSGSIDQDIRWAGASDWVLEPQQDRSRRMLGKILDAATALFTGKGYENTTVGDIAALAGISSGSVYRRFPDKEAVLYTVLSAYYAKRLSEFDRIMSERSAELTHPRDVVRFYVKLIFSAYRNDHAVVRLCERAALSDAVVREMVSRNSAYVATRTAALLSACWPAARIDLEAAMIRLHSVIRGALVLLVLSDEPAPWPTISVADRSFEKDIEAMALAWFGFAASEEQTATSVRHQV